jgi:L,D-peptidoglycan transpeptidase YkuD (ErfK/YbiS/YcfS/YnhG family)
VPAVVGRAGTGWGRGLHGDGAPAGRPGPVKVEGDGRAPAGAFRVLRAFGYEPAPPAGTALPYQAVGASWRCVDDPASAFYNDILDADQVEVDWTSAETMRRADDLYRWVVELDHNAASGDAPTPGAGSCIFLHRWAGPDDVTAGCTALAEPALVELLAWLRPGAVYVLLPRAERAALASAWGLP